MSEPQKFTSLNHRIAHYFNRLWPVLIVAISVSIIWTNIDEGKPFDWTALLAALGMLVVGHFFGRFIEWLYVVDARHDRKQDRDE